MTLSTTSGCHSCRGDRLKLISNESPSARHSASCRLSSSTTQSPIASIRPISSASGMNSPGGIRPPPGSGQRISASTPIIPPVAEVDERLVVQHPALVLDGLAQPCAERELCPSRPRRSAACRKDPPGPSCLLRNIALSACFRSVSASSACLREEADAERRRHVELGAGDLERLPQRTPGSSTRRTRRRRRRGPPREGSGGSSRSASSIRNSSPPGRATRSVSRVASRRRSATRTISSSPASWPRLSLTSLKLSMSTEMTATPSPCRRARASESSKQLVEQDAVGQAGQLVVVREERDLLLGLLALRDVEHHALEIERFTRGTVHDDGAVAEPQHATVAGDEPVLERERLAVGPTLHVGGHGSRRDHRGGDALATGRGRRCTPQG